MQFFGQRSDYVILCNYALRKCVVCDENSEVKVSPWWFILFPQPADQTYSLQLQELQLIIN